MPAPDEFDVIAYLGRGVDSDETEGILSALAAEKAAQAVVCRVPADDEEWPADLAEALCRRAVRTLSMRNLPLGFQTEMSETSVAAIRVSADREIARLEGPYRKWVVG